MKKKAVLFFSIDCIYITVRKENISDSFKVRKKAKIRNRFNQVPHLNQDTTWESDKNTIKQHIQESLKPYFAL